MGTQFNFEGASRCYHTNMKAFIVLFALFAAAMAEAEADPALFYANAYGGYYGGFGAYPYTYGYGAYPYAAYTYAGCRNNAGALVPCAHGGVAGHVVAKREADSDPAYFVTPYLAQYGFPRTFYGNGLVHTSHYGICTNYLGQQVSC